MGMTRKLPCDHANASRDVVKEIYMRGPDDGQHGSNPEMPVKSGFQQVRGVRTQNAKLPKSPFSLVREADSSSKWKVPHWKSVNPTAFAVTDSKDIYC